MNPTPNEPTPEVPTNDAPKPGEFPRDVVDEVTPEQPKREAELEFKLRSMIAERSLVIATAFNLFPEAQMTIESEINSVVAVALSTQAAELERVTKERDALRDKVEKAKVFVESDLTHFDRGFRIERITLESLDALLKEKP